MLRALYQPEKAKELYESMLLEEQQTTCYLMKLCEARKEALSSSDDVLFQSLPYSLVEKDVTLTDKVDQCLRYLGYKPQSISGTPSGESTPIAIINW